MKLVFLVAMTALAASCAVKRYHVEGMVVAVDPARRTMVVSHRAIPGFMDAMVMPFQVRDPRELKQIAPGARIEFELEVGPEHSSAGKIRRLQAGLEGVAEVDGQEFRLPKPRGVVPVGAKVPDFELIDQLNQPVRLSDFTGKVVAVNFLYTRCPLPDVCPRLAANFAALQRRFRGRLADDLVLLSITIDPRYDTPQVLADYARRWKAGHRGWRFLTGPEKSIEAVAGSFGLIFWAEEGQIVHTSSTALIRPDGSLAAVVEGPSYRVGQLAELIEYLLEADSQ